MNADTTTAVTTTINDWVEEKELVIGIEQWKFGNRLGGMEER